ncbi:PAS domain-containing sensor histidine kinase [Aggregatilinea lenta]|uniref:PAS domain-containing sensor histidine kinase n=1 Tax=Aggregatilinea lenta TaxID=913108 RepID=UPI000E5BC4DA|nr:PAS domain S-box protein [Aggregatilinea lenta]
MTALFQKGPAKDWRRVVSVGIGLGALFWLSNALVHLLLDLAIEADHPVTTGRADLLAGLVSFLALGLYFEIASYRQRSIDDRLRQLSRAVEQSPSTVMITNLAGQIEYVNPKFTALTGYTLEEVAGRNPNILKSGETSSDEYARMWTAIKAGDEWRGEFHNRKKNGELYWEYASISPIKDAHGRITHYLAVKEDITARKEAEVAERAQRLVIETLRDMANAINELIDISDVLDFILTHLAHIVPYDAAYVIIFDDANAHVVRCYGYDKPGQDLIFALRKQTVSGTVLAQMFKDQTPLALTAAAYSNSYWGQAVVLSQAASHLLAPVRLRGRLIGLLALEAQAEAAFGERDAWRLQAVAEQTATAVQNAHVYDAMRDYAIEREQQLIERSAELDRERAKLRAIFDSMGEGVAYTENEYVQYVNHALVIMLGYSEDEIIEQQLTLFKLAAPTDADDSQDLRDRIGQAFNTQRPWRGELRLRRKDGTVLETSVTTTQVTGPYDKILGRVTIIRDISRDKAVLAQKNRFLTHAAHELRTPMSNLKTRLYLMRRQPEKTVQHLDVLDEVSNGMARLVEDLLDVVRLEHDAMQLRSEVVPLQAVLQDAIDSLRQVAEQSGIDIAATLPQAEIPVCVDRRRITQAITNLITMAIQNSLPGGTITIRLHTDDGRKRPVLTILDAGMDLLSGSEMGQVFEPFFWATQGRVDGVSLGLTIARDIIELHNGEIALETTEGQGTLFKVTLNGAQDCAEVDGMAGISYAVRQ